MTRRIRGGIMIIRNVYSKIGLTLKILAMVMGSLLILYGFIGGILGFHPGGKIEYVEIRLNGIFILLLGIIYYIPNSRIVKHIAIKISYFFVTLIPFLFYVNNKIGLFVWFNMKYFAIIETIVRIPLYYPYSLYPSLAAPLSLIFYILGPQKREREDT
jgi:hypothetical protein